MPGRASGLHLHPLAHKRDPRPVQAGPPAGLHRVAVRLRRSSRAPGDVDAVVVGSSIGSAAACDRRIGSGAPSSCASDSTTSPG